MDDSVFVIDSNRKVLYANSKLSKLLHQTSENICGKSINDLFPGNGVKRLMRCIDVVFEVGEIDKIEFKTTINHEVYWLETTLIPRYRHNTSDYIILAISRNTTERRKMEDDLKSLIGTLKSQQETLKLLSSEVIRAQEAERKRISRELHDEVGQALTAISINLELIRQDSVAMKNLKQRIHDCKNLVEKTIEDLHRVTYELRPAMLDDLGLLPAFRSHAKNYEKRTGITIHIDGPEEIEQLDSEIKTVIYRVFQEGLNNVVKHAQANRVKIHIEMNRGKVIFSISDNGKGFNTRSLLRKKPEERGLGLQGISERVRIVGGHLHLKSKPRQGTILQVDIPVAKA